MRRSEENFWEMVLSSSTRVVSQSWQVPVPAAPPQWAPEEVHSESATAVSNGLKTPDLSLRSMTLGEYPRIFHSSQKRLVFPLTD